MKVNHIKKLPLVDIDNNLVGLVTLKDIENKTKYPLMNVDINGNLYK